MMSLVLITLFLGIFTVDGLPLSRQINDINTQQQYIGYTTNTLHQNLDYPDQRAESTVKTNYNYNNNNGQSQIIHNYNQQQQQQPVISYQQSPPQQSQLFNVGYSVKFANNNNNRHVQIQRQRPKYNDGEIITGTRKHNEQVRVPDFNLTPQEFVSNALIENKKAKLSGIKTKHAFIQSMNVPDPKLLINQANLTPTTQKFYKNLEYVQVPQQNQADLQQKYTWRNLSPSVEIIQSTEVPVVQKYTNNEPKYFDHSSALGRSQGFDYTNVMDVNNNQPQQQQQQVATIVNNVATPVTAQIPVDTSLLKEPVRIDTRFIQEVLRQNYESNQPQYTPKYQTIQPQAFYNNHNDKPVNYQDYQQEPSRYQYRIYNKPLEHTERRPRYVQYSLQTDLQPPPMITSRFQRRISG